MHRLMCYGRAIIVTIVFMSFIMRSADFENVKKNLAFEIIVSHDWVPFAPLMFINKDTFNRMQQIYAVRCNHLKAYVQNHGLSKQKIFYTPNNLLAYYIENADEQHDKPALVCLSHCDSECKKELKAYSSFNRSRKEQAIFKKYALRVFNDACYMYDTHTKDEQTAGTFVRVPHGGNVEHVYAYCKVDDVYVPTGWLAGLLPKLHDELINTGACTYFSWEVCTKGDLKKIEKECRSIIEVGGDYRNSGILVFDINTFSAISKEDTMMLYWMTPKIRDSLDSDGLVGVYYTPSQAGIYVFSEASLMHMHMSWGAPENVAHFLQSQKPARYTVPHYGEFVVSAFTEKISFKPYATKLKKVKAKAYSLFSGKQKQSLILQQGDEACKAIIQHLQKNNAFALQNWLAEGKSLAATLRTLRNSRYTFTHNETSLLLHDMVKNGLYVITLISDKVPTLQFLPNVGKADYALTDTGYMLIH